MASRSMASSGSSSVAPAKGRSARSAPGVTRSQTRYVTVPARRTSPTTAPYSPNPASARRCPTASRPLTSAVGHSGSTARGGPMGRLDQKVALTTGAARGQGRAHAVKMAQEGADIIAVDLCAQIETIEYPMATPEDLEETVKLVEDQDRRIVAQQADVRSRDALQAAVDAGVAELGRLDIVVANAGIAPIFGDMGHGSDAWRDAIDVLLTGVYYTID